jgi:outer membrane protein insertion porin family
VLIFLHSQNLAANDLSIGKLKNLFRVDEIQVEGNKKVEAPAIIEKVNITVGNTIDNYQVRDAIKTIYSLRYFDEVEVHKKVEKGKNILLFKVVEKPVITKILFVGNDEVSAEDLKAELKTKDFNILDINTIKQDVKKLTEFYEEKGFYLASINYELQENEQKNLDLVFKIKEFQKVRVKKIMFLGNKDLPDDELKQFMQTQEESLFSGLSGSGNFKEFNFQTDIERLKYLYKTKGYLQVNIGDPVITVSEDKKWIFITLKVKEGPKFSVNELYFNGELLFTEKEMREKLKLKPGDVYSEETLRKDIQTLTELYQDKGYAFANVLRTLRIVPGENKVDIYYSFEKGKIAYFGKIIVKGNNKTRDKVVRRELRIHEGMKFSGSKLRLSKENVNRLGFFEPGSVIFNTVSPKGKDDVLDVEISIKERQTGQLSVGAGYSTAQNGFFQASIAQNNFRGLGQNLNLNVQLAERQNNINLGFTEPYFLDTLWTAGADIFSNRNALTQNFASERIGGALRVGYPLSEYVRIFFTFQHEDTTLEDVANPTVDVDLENGVAAFLRTTLRYDKRNNIFEPTDGFFASMSLEYSGLYGEKTWFKSTAETRYYQPLYKDLIFRQRVLVQRVSKVGERDIPRTEKYQMGGARNMRGYPFEGVGPKVFANDERTGQPRFFNQGGLLLALFQFELEQPLVREAGLKWVVFYDAGNVFEEDWGDIGENNGTETLRQNYGFGFRWFSPIGVLRFEFGYPIDESGPQQFHFDIGQLF